MTVGEFELVPVGTVRSDLTDRSEAPRQGDEGAPEAWIEFFAAYVDAIADLAPAQEVLLLTWLDRADRTVLRTQPRNDPAAREHGVFSTRSPDRPNPIGLHRVEILEVDGVRVKVSGLEALDGTPVLDVKPALGPVGER